jgi:cytoskeletal protein CcmA (bactofilin family)
VQRPPLPAAVAWTTSLGLWMGLDLLSRAALVAVAEGIRAVPVAFALVLGGTLLSRRLARRPTVAATLALVTALAAAVPASATELRTARYGQSTVVVPATETIDDTLVVSADTVIVEGVVLGDIIAFGGQVRLAGRTHGSLLCLARRLDVDGQVDGDVYAVVDSIGVRGRVERNVHLASARADLAAGSVVARDLVALVQEARLGGLVGRDARTYARQTDLGGSVGRDAHLVSDRVLLEPSAVVAGDLIARTAAAGDVRIAEGAQVRGARRLNDEAAGQVRGPRYVPSPFLKPGFYLWQALWLAAALLAAALVFALAPLSFAVQPRSATALLKSIGLGFVALVATPIAAAVLALTVVGLPLAFAAACGWLAIVYLSFVFTSAWLGRLVLRQASDGLGSFLLAVLAGEVLLRVATHLPFVDSALWLLALLFGAGLGAASLPRLWQRLRAR